MHKRIDPGRLNGIGGRVEPGEDFLNAAIRETAEETGYTVAPADIQLAGVVKLEGGYAEDWVMCFFKIRVPDTRIPKGAQTEDGELIWLHKDDVLDSGHELVDDLNYCFKDIVAGSSLIFVTAKVNEHQKITEVRIGKIGKI